MRTLFAFLMLLSPAIGQDIFQPTGRYSESSESGCYLAVFSTRNCGPCQRWKRDDLPRLEAAGHRVALIDIDIDDRWKVDRVPTFWVIDRQTKKVVKQFVGTVSADTLLPLLKAQRSSDPILKSARMTRSQMVSLHNQLHGGGSWTWPGDLETHLRTAHGVRFDD
jgi:hypothetical protein